VFHGKPVLTWWEGKALSGLGTGTHVILDDTYRVITRVPAGHGRQSDLHEFLITPQNTGLLTSYELREADLTSVGGPPDGTARGVRQGRGGAAWCRRSRCRAVESSSSGGAWTTSTSRRRTLSTWAIHSITSTSTRST